MLYLLPLNKNKNVIIKNWWILNGVCLESDLTKICIIITIASILVSKNKTANVYKSPTVDEGKYLTDLSFQSDNLAIGKILSLLSSRVTTPQ